MIEALLMDALVPKLRVELGVVKWRRSRTWTTFRYRNIEDGIPSRPRQAGITGGIAATSFTGLRGPSVVKGAVEARACGKLRRPIHQSRRANTVCLPGCILKPTCGWRAGRTRFRVQPESAKTEKKTRHDTYVGPYSQGGYNGTGII